MASSSAVKTLNTTVSRASGCASSQERTARTAMGAASSRGNPKTPVLMQQKTMLVRPSAAAASRQRS